ncbi:MAG: oligosaccharide flippase family protein, partial [Chitinophagaceae bacterium]|nr:oligosaccharide flippase family protein [Chitinophagaceae bacterium]
MTPYFVRIAGAQNFGLINIAQSVVQYLFLFVGFNLDITAAAEIAVIKDDIKKSAELFSNVLFSRLLLLVISCVIFLIIIGFYVAAGKDVFLLSVTFIGLIGYTITPLWFYQGVEDFKNLFVFTAIGKIVFAVIVFTAVRSQTDYWYYNLGMSVSYIISGLLLLGFAIRKYKIKITRLSFSESFDYLKKRFSLFTSGTFVSFGMNINITILSIVLSLSDFGLYMAANKLILILFTMVTLTLNQSLFPHLSRIISANFENAVEVVKKKVLPSLTYVTLVVCIGAFVFTKMIIWVLLGPTFVDAGVFFRIMLVSLIANVLTNVIVLQFFIKMNRLDGYAMSTKLSTVVGILATFVFSSLFAAPGASIAWL